MSVIEYKPFFLSLTLGLCSGHVAPVLASPKIEVNHSAAPSRVLRGRCISVRDGDTVVVLVGLSTYTVHLFGIDAPEKGQPFGYQAKDSLWELAFGQTLAVYPHATKSDSNSRLVGWVFAGQIGLNVEQLKRGMAWYDQQDAPKESKLAALESAARFSRVGLWRSKAPVAPWKWPKSKSESPPKEMGEMQGFTKTEIEAWKSKF